MKSIDKCKRILKFTKFMSNPNWEQYGISVNYTFIPAEYFTGKPYLFWIINSGHKYKLNISCPDESDTLIFNEIIKMVESEIMIQQKIHDIVPLAKWLYSIYEACLKVNKLRVFA